ncbi:hypothetical protein C3L33_08454, partial [Rhododendron williamsianum]
MQSTLKITLFFFFTVSLLLHVSPCLSFTSFVFGDSLVDAGNNDYLFTLSKADSPPYGIDFTPSGGRPTGRFTNGRTISDILALGAKTFPPPYLSPGSASNAITVGMNYASGASGILDETGSVFIGRIPLGAQIDYFQKTRSYMVSAMGENGTREFLREAILSITIGSNDVLNYFQPSVPFLGEENKVSATAFQDFMVSNFTLQLKVMARSAPHSEMKKILTQKFICLDKNKNKGSKAQTEVNTFVQGYNKKLRAALDRLNREMGPEAIFVHANSYDVFSRILQNYGQFGFENAEDPCCGGYFPPFVCFKGSDANTSSFLCEDRSKYLFWDAYHPTEAANIIVAESLLNGGQS